MFNATNTTGWTELLDANVLSASFLMYDTLLVGWTVTLLFLLHQIILFMKAKNPTLNFVIGSLFVSIYIAAEQITSYTIINPAALTFMFLILVVELAMLLYTTFIGN